MLSGHIDDHLRFPDRIEGDPAERPISRPCYWNTADDHMRTPPYHLVRKLGRIDDADVDIWSQSLDCSGDGFAIREQIVGHHQT